MITLKIQIREFDYSSNLDKYVPNLLKHMKKTGDTSNPLLKAAEAAPNASALVLKGILATMTKKQKEDLACMLLNTNIDSIINALNNLATNNGMVLDIESAEAKVIR
ncbi:MAG: hypothetical protein II564_06235 [Oscillospiraceae bacterium]|jgi:nitroreductase|nr:hypothetical protein [Oscillospiraceae bacterium]MBQ5870730.1 hypothetical protein [Lachnospiraceae bacterium]